MAPSRFHLYLLLFSLFLIYIVFQSRALIFGPKLRLSYPDRLVLSEKTVTINGQTTPLSQVFINDQEAVVDREGNFSFPLSLRTGVNEAEVKAKNRFGKEKVKAISIIVREK